MVPRIHAGGKSFSGLVACLTHDAGTPAERRPKTAARVGMVELENLPDCEAATAARIMAGTVRDAEMLKELAGVSSRGRKLAKPVYHYSLSWPPEKSPDRAEMLEAAQGSLQALGMGDRQALVVEHTHCAYCHVHVVVNRVSFEDGRAASCAHDARKLSAWAERYERDHGGIAVSGRVAAREARERYAGVVAALTPKDAAPEDRRRICAAVREQHPLPPRERVRGAGRPPRTEEQRRDWAEQYRRERAEQPLPAERREQRRLITGRHRLDAWAEAWQAQAQRLEREPEAPAEAALATGRAGRYS